jgi:hypothetical protein
MQIDHVIIAVNDLDTAAQRLRERFGLNAGGGGTHPMGTANLGIPLKPPQYLELLAIGDKEIASANPFGKLVMEKLAGGDCLLGWAVSAEDIEAQGERLNRRVVPGEIRLPDGNVGRWQNVFAGIDEFEALPFFIRYQGDNTDRRLDERYAKSNSPARPGAIAWLEVGGDRQRLLDWLGTDTLPLRFVDGSPGLHAVAIESPNGEIVIRNEDL